MVMHMSAKVTVAVAGASGYAGGEVLRLLCGHPDATIGAGVSMTGDPEVLAHVLTVLEHPID